MDVKLPDGRILKNVPEGTTKAEISKKLGLESPAPTLQKPSIPSTIFDQSMQGATFNMADEATSALAAVPVSMATGMSIPEAYNAGQELSRRQLAAQEKEHGGISTASNIAGGLLTGAAGMGTKAGAAVASGAYRGLLPQAKGLAGRAANLFTKALVGGSAGAASGALSGFGAGESGQRGESAKQGAVFGGAVGATLPVALGGLGTAATAAIPKADEGLVEVARLAQKFDIPVSVDQLTSSKAVKTAQKVSQELVGSGQASFRDSQIKKWQRALLKEVGADADRVTPEVMNAAFKKVGGEFDKLGAGKTFDIKGFDQSVKDILVDAESTATQDAIKNFNKAVKRVKMNVSKDGTISGEKISMLRSNVNQLSRKASNPDTKELLKDLENAIIDVMTAGDDVAKGQLSNAKYQYKNLLAIEPLAQKAKGGNISPSLLANRVAKIYGRQYTTGQAGNIGELSRVGYELLPELGGSDTAQKMAFMGGAMYGLGAEPVSVAAGLAVNRALQSGVNRNQKVVSKMLDKTEKSLAKIKNNETKKLTKE